MRMLSEDFIGTCQWCFGEFKINSNKKVVLHGFTRPGYGYTVGQCHGVGHEPFEYGHALTDQRIAMIKSEIKKSQSILDKIDAGKVTKVPNPGYLPPEELEKKRASRYYRESGEPTVEFFGSDHDSFEWLLKRLRANTLSRMTYDQKTLAEFERLVANWTLGAIIGIDSPATGKERYVKDAYDPDKVEARQAHEKAKAVREAKPGKISVILFRPSSEVTVNAHENEDEWRAMISKHYDMEEEFKVAVRNWAKKTFSGKVWVGDAYSGDVGRHFKGLPRNINSVTMRIEWHHLDDLLAMFPESQYVIRYDENAKKVRLIVSSEAFPDSLKAVT